MSIAPHLHSMSRRPHLRLACLGALLLLAWAPTAAAQPPSHDPSRMIRNADGRYWIFTTGDGVWAMSSSSPGFTDWRPERTVFPVGTWPGWINNHVSGFGGFFWAPDVIFWNGRYYLYYSCAGVGAPAAIGLATATNLNGPWTDQGLVVAGNNAIDPAPFVDGGNLWLTWGNWQTGIDLLQLDPATGKPLNSNRWDLVPGQVEAPYLLREGGFYYLFFQKGLCCSGLSSTYYTVVGRSPTITGPYLDRSGVSVLNGGGSVFLPNRDGRYVGPGHVGYGEGRLTYHFYDGNDNGAPKLRVTTLGFSNGWPVAGGVSLPDPAIANGTYRLRNRASGKYLDNLGATADGANVGQWASSASNNQRWVVTSSAGFTRMRGVTGGKYLDSIGRTANGSVVGQWASSASPNQQWSLVPTGAFYKVVNRANGKALDTGGQTADGAPMQFWPNGTSTNQQWTFELVNTSTSLAGLEVLVSPAASEVRVSLAKPAAGGATAILLDGAGTVVLSEAFTAGELTIGVAHVPAGRYLLEVTGPGGLVAAREIVIKR
jgi:arabinan endo-1,5-alpha-L-arabinosidase